MAQRPSRFAFPMRGVSFRPKPRPYPLLGLGATQAQPVRRGPSMLAPAAGTRAADAYRRALQTSSPYPGVLPNYGRGVDEAFAQARSSMNVIGEPPKVFGIRGVSRKSKKRSAPKRSRKRTTKRVKGRVTCKVQSIRTPSGKRVRRTVCRNSRGQIVSNKKKRTRRK